MFQKTNHIFNKPQVIALSLTKFILIWVGSQFISSSFIPSKAQAEPWLSTRYSQNCAGCHAPGRKNLQPVDRRCSLSCQGCHVNPNGGGLRSAYGKWNENKWLASFRNSSYLKHDKHVKPTAEQAYGKKKWKSLNKQQKATYEKKFSDHGFPLKESDDATVNESVYDRRDKLEFVTAKSQEEWMYQIPHTDPYRAFDYGKTDGGGDIRWQVFKVLKDEISPEGANPKFAKKKEWTSFLMTADVAARWRPLYRNLHFVYEGRALGNPQPRTKVEDTLSLFGTRSLYAMVDNLPFNIFVMGGMYRPLFGNYTPDHTALTQRLFSSATGKQSYASVYKAISLGTAPNVPYGNLHIIDGGPRGDETRGIAANLGLRFVSYSASANYSFWRTDDKADPEKPISLEMHSMHLGAMLANTVFSAEYIFIKKDQPLVGFNQGGVMAFETYTRFWREMYAVANFAMANVTEDILPGSTTEIKTGVRSFWIPGVETMVLYEIENQKKGEVEGDYAAHKYNSQRISWQIHTFF